MVGAKLSVCIKGETSIESLYFVNAGNSVIDSYVADVSLR